VDSTCLDYCDEHVIRYKRDNDSVTFEVRVTARSSKSEIVGEFEGALKIRIAAPPVDGAANTELVRTLSKAFGVPRGSVSITGGLTSRLKTVRVSGINPEQVLAVVSRI
jgi:uncharacterized protein (TIGR00251 family)